MKNSSQKPSKRQTKETVKKDDLKNISGGLSIKIRRKEPGHGAGQ